MSFIHAKFNVCSLGQRLQFASVTCKRRIQHPVHIIFIPGSCTVRPLFTCHILSVGFFPFIVTGCREAQCQILLNNSYLQWPNQNNFIFSLSEV